VEIVKIYEPVNTEELVAEIRRITEEVIIPLAENKGHDYTGQEGNVDALANVGETLGWAGAFFRGRDKDRRLMTHLTKRTLKVQDDSVENCFVDRLLYCYLAYIMWMRRDADVFIDFDPLPRESVEYLAWICPDCGNVEDAAPAHGCLECGWCSCESAAYKMTVEEL
jgi:hypothetical protein